MLGCASESALVELIEPLAKWLDSVDPGNSFRNQIRGAKPMSDKLRTIRNAVQPKRKLFPPAWQEDLEIRFDAIANALRVHRNKAGHPTFQGIDHGAARDLLIILPDYLRRLCELRDWLIARASSPSAD